MAESRSGGGSSEGFPLSVSCSAASAVASIQVTEAIKILVASLDSILPGLLVMDFWRNQFHFVKSSQTRPANAIGRRNGSERVQSQGLPITALVLAGGMGTRLRSVVSTGLNQWPW